MKTALQQIFFKADRWQQEAGFTATAYSQRLITLSNFLDTIKFK
jgi:hypothetical protein